MLGCESQGHSLRSLPSLLPPPPPHQPIQPTTHNTSMSGIGSTLWSVCIVSTHTHLTSGYIVVFKKTASQEEIDKYASEVNSAGKSICAHPICLRTHRVCRRPSRPQVHRILAQGVFLSFQISSSDLTRSHIRQGFSAQIPQDFLLQLQQLTSSGPIDYIGACVSLMSPLAILTSSTLPYRGGPGRYHPVETETDTTTISTRLSRMMYTAIVPML